MNELHWHIRRFEDTHTHLSPSHLLLLIITQAGHGNASTLPLQITSMTLFHSQLYIISQEYKYVEGM